VTMQSRSGQGGRAGGRTGWWLALALSAWLLSPALSSVHVEGFSAQIQSLALVMAQQGSIAGHDLARPVISQYIFLTRPGVVDILALADAVFGNLGDAGFRMLMAASVVVLVWASALAARQMGGVRLRVGLFVCVLTPGLVELGFYFNDNLVSAAFSALAVCAAWRTGGRRTASANVHAAATGVLAVCAVLCRIDGLLALPLVALLFVLRQQQPAPAVLRGATMLAAAALTHLAAARFNGGSPADAWPLLQHFSSFSGDHGRLPGKGSVMYFFGAVTPLLLLPGMWRFWRHRPQGWRFGVWLAAFWLYPLAVLLHSLRTGSEIRYYLPLLAPLVALFAGQGWRVLRAWHRRGTLLRRCSVIALAAAGVVSMLMPPLVPAMKDGPRVMVGRLWSTVLWQRWQGSVDASLAQVRAVVDAVNAGSLHDAADAATVMTLHWNDEFYLRLRLFEAGFQEVPAGVDCRPLSRYRRASQVVWHVRLFPQYKLQPFEPELSAALVLSALTRCADWHAGPATWVTTFEAPLPYAVASGIRLADLPGPFRFVVERPFVDDWSQPPRAPPALQYGMVSAAPFSPDRLQDLARRAAGRVAHEALLSGQSQAAMLDRHEQAYRAR